jgi:hypothetical protein
VKRRTTTMVDEEARAATIRRRIRVVGLVVSALGAVVLPVPTTAVAESWRELSLNIAVMVVTIAAIWLGMLFGVALDRARKGSGGGGSDLVRHLMRPLWVGGLTLLGLMAVKLSRPFLDPITLPGPWGHIGVRFGVFVDLLLCCGSLYGLLLALAPAKHIYSMLRVEEHVADSTPPAAAPELEPWQHR